MTSELVPDFDIETMWNCLIGDAFSGAVDPPDAPPPSGRTVDHDEYLLRLARATGIPRWAIEAGIYTSIGKWDRTRVVPTAEAVEEQARQLHHAHGVVREIARRGL
jgi:hypothetical protein